MRTTYRPHQGPPTCLRLTYQHLVHGPACEIGSVELFLRGPGCRRKSTRLAGWRRVVICPFDPPPWQASPHDDRPHSSPVPRRPTAALAWLVWLGGEREGPRTVSACAPFQPPAGLSVHTSAVPPPPRRPPMTAPLRTAPMHTTDGPATVFVRSKCSGTASLRGYPGPIGSVPAPPTAASWAAT